MRRIAFPTGLCSAEIAIFVMASSHLRFLSVGASLAANCNALGRNSTVEAPRIPHATRQTAAGSPARMHRPAAAQPSVQYPAPSLTPEPLPLVLDAVAGGGQHLA